MNVFMMTGRLTHDVEVAKTPNGASVANFSIAVDRDYKNKDGEYDTDFFNCVAWGTTAENIARFFKKGEPILIHGSAETRQYQDKETGKNRTVFELKVDKFEFMRSKNDK